MKRNPNFLGVPREREQLEAESFDAKQWLESADRHIRAGTYAPGSGFPPPPNEKIRGPQFFPNKKAVISIKEAVVPDANASLGFAGPAVSIDGKGSFVGGYLWVPIEE